MTSSELRYDYSPIVARPDYHWPGGRRLAVYIALNVEHFTFGRGRGAHIAPPEQSTSHSVYSWRDYGNRVGFWRLLELFDELTLPIEAQVNASLYAHWPEIPDALIARGDEILGHGLTNSQDQGDLEEPAEQALIREATETITRHQGEPPVGWMSPWISQTARTPDLLREAGYRYMMDWSCDDQPIWMRTRAGPILAIPYPVEINDNRAIVFHKVTAAQFADMIIDDFDEMLAQSVRQPLVFGISLHTFVVGRPFRLRQLRRALKHVADHRERIWLTRPRDICCHVETLPAGTVPGGGEPG